MDRGHIIEHAPIMGIVDKFEQMLGSYGPAPTGEPYKKDFPPEVCFKPKAPFIDL